MGGGNKSYFDLFFWKDKVFGRQHLIQYMIIKITLQSKGISPGRLTRSGIFFTNQSLLSTYVLVSKLVFVIAPGNIDFDECEKAL